MKLGLSVSAVENDPANPTFTLRGYLPLDDDLPMYIWVNGYVGMTGDTLHLREIPTLRVSNQAKILQHVAENEKKLLRSIKRKLSSK